MTEILIIKPSSLADIVHGLQVATSMKAQRDDLRISWIVRDIYAPLVRACEAVDATYVFERNGGTKGFLRLIRDVRKTKFDFALDFQGLLRSGLMTSRVRAAKKIGRTDAREMSGMFYDQRVPLPPDGRRSHALEILLQFLSVVNAKPELRGQLRFREVDKLNLKFATGRGGSRPIIMFPDSRRSERLWHGFKQLTDLILKSDRTRKVIWAGSEHMNDRDSFVPEQFLNLTGNTSLVSLPALLKRAAWVISNDSGPMHLAAALGVPTLGIFGPTDPRVAGPYPLTSPCHEVVQAPVGNMKLLTAKEVYRRWTKAAARVDAL